MFELRDFNSYKEVLTTAGELGRVLRAAGVPRGLACMQGSRLWAGGDVSLRFPASVRGGQEQEDTGDARDPEAPHSALATEEKSSKGPAHPCRASPTGTSTPLPSGVPPPPIPGLRAVVAKA